MAHPARGAIALLRLHQVQRAKDGGSLLIGRVLREHVVENGATLARELEWLSLVQPRALRFLEPGRVVHQQRLEAHRSTAPMTTSVGPMTAITSAIMPPTIASGSAWQA